MKKTILVYGAIASLVTSLLMYINMTLVNKGTLNFDNAEITGYVSIILGFTLIFFGVRSYRENIGNGHITFGRALGTGILIALIGSFIYAVLWAFIFSPFFPHFCDDYAKYNMDRMAKDTTATAAQMKEFTDQMEWMKTAIKNPFMNTALSFLEPFPVGALIAFISAFILKKKKTA